jgi:hypothetical protein
VLPLTPERKYINVRRRSLSVEEPIDEETHRVMFEPNEAPL